MRGQGLRGPLIFLGAVKAVKHRAILTTWGH